MSTALAVANKARTVATTAERELTTAEANLKGLEARLAPLTERVQELGARLADLQQKAATNPAKFGPALAETKAKLEALRGQLAGLTSSIASTRASVDTSTAKLKGAQSDALEKARTAQLEAMRTGKGLDSPNNRARYVDSLEDAASLSKAQQRVLLGSEVRGISAEKALKTDVDAIKAKLNGRDPTEALAELDARLQGTDPAMQEALVIALGPEMKKLAKLAYGREDSAEKYFSAMNGVSPGARMRLVEGLVTNAPHRFESSGVGLALETKLKSGVGFDTARELNKAFLKVGNDVDAASVHAVMASGIQALKQDFEEQYATAAHAKAELAMLEQGFGAFMTPAEKKKAAEAFHARHDHEIKAAERSAERLTGALGEIQSVTLDSGHTQSPHIHRSIEALRDAATDLVSVTGKLSDTEAGQKAARQALEESLTGKKTWLDDLVNVTKGSKDGADNAAKLVTSAIVAKAVGGGLMKKDQLGKVLQRYAPALGLKKDTLGKLADELSNIDGSPESTKRLEKAFREIDNDQFGSSKVAKNSLKAIGLALSLHGVVKGMQGFSDADRLEKVKTIVQTAQLGVDGGIFALEMFGKKGALEALGKVSGGLNALGGLLDVVSGIKGIASGDASGAADLLSGAGGLTLAYASFAGTGAGALTGVGAALAVASVIAKIGIAKYESNEKEDAAQDDARAFLRAGGMSEKLAGALDDVLASNHSNSGEVLQAIAKKLNWPMSYMLVQLEAIPEKDLKAFISAALDVKRDDEGRLEQHDLGRSDNVARPKSVETITERFKAVLRDNDIFFSE